MKKILIIAVLAMTAMTAGAQKFALLDMEYILKTIPQYEMANEQLNQVSLRWQKEVEAKSKEAETLYKKRESLISPIQDEVYNAVKEVSDLRGYSLVVDRSSDSGIIFGSPKIDISNEILQKLGYSN